MAELRQFYTITGKDKEKSEDMCYFERPKLLGFVRNENQVLSEANKLAYLKLPERDSLPLELNVPFENYTFRDPGFSDKLNKVTWFIGDQACYGRNILEKSEDDVENAHKIQVVTHRGALTHLMQTVYKMRSAKWTMRAIKYKGILYLMNHNLEPHPKQPLTHKPCETHHSKLQKLCFVDHPSKKPQPITEINENNQTYSIYSSQLENISLLYSCEMDGVLSRAPVDINNIEEMRKCQYVHVKSFFKGTQGYLKKFKYMHWWIIAYLENVNDLFVAYKDSDGIVEERLGHIKVQTMPLKQNWSPGVMNRFLHTFINKVADIMKDVDSKSICYEFRLEDEINIKYRVCEGDQFTFLNRDYIEFIEANF